MSDGNLQAARINSLAVFVVSYVGLSFATAHHERLSMLMKARGAVATILLASPDRASLGSIPGLGAVDYREGEVSTEGLFGSERTSGWRVTVTARNGRWTVSVTGYDDGYADLRDVAADFRVENLPSEGELPREYVRVYQDIEAKAGQGVEVPGTGVQFLGIRAVWACTLFVAGLLIVMRDRVQQTLAKGATQDGDRRLAVDGRGGLERALAIGELLGLLFAPPALTAGLLLTITSQVMADGADTSVVSDAAVGTLALTLLCVNTWLSLTTVAQVLALRQRRSR
jgi:hypothetical protein